MAHQRIIFQAADGEHAKMAIILNVWSLQLEEALALQCHSDSIPIVQQGFGSGFAIPSMAAMKCGANRVFLQELPIDSLLAMQRTLFSANGLSTESGAFRQVAFKWGTFPLDFVKETPEIGLFMAADCIYDKNDFDDLVATIAFFLEKFRNIPLVMCYQDRNIMYSIIEPLDFWGLKAALIPMDSFGFYPKKFASLNDLSIIQDFPTENLDKVLFMMEVRRIDERFTFAPI